MRRLVKVCQECCWFRVNSDFLRPNREITYRCDKGPYAELNLLEADFEVKTWSGGSKIDVKYFVNCPRFMEMLVMNQQEEASGGTEA